MTRRGLAALHDERAALETARPDAEASGGATALAAHHARLSALDARIASAVMLDVTSLPHNEVRFSASVTLQGPAGQQRRYRIVGVDEADPESGRIAFTAPLAQKLTGKQRGDSVSLRNPGGETDYEIIAIDYAQE